MLMLGTTAGEHIKNIRRGVARRHLQVVLRRGEISLLYRSQI